MSVDNKAYTNKYNSYPVGSEVECKAVPFSLFVPVIGYSPIQLIAKPAYHKAENTYQQIIGLQKMSQNKGCEYNYVTKKSDPCKHVRTYKLRNPLYKIGNRLLFVFFQEIGSFSVFRNNH